MSRKKFVVTSSIAMVLIAGIVASLAFYTNYVANASVRNLPEALSYLPANSQAIFGMNVQKFVSSPAFTKFEDKHGKQFANNLAEFITKTGVDPRRDLTYIVAGGRALDGKGEAVIVASGQFDSVKITDYINSHGATVRADYKGITVLVPAADKDSKLNKAVAFLTSSEIALGELEAVKGVIDVHAGSAPGVITNTTLGPLLAALNPDEMFWFAGDPASILSKAPANTPFGSSISAIQNVVGTLNLTDIVSGKITATARDEDSARKLADVVRGLVALGQLASEHDQTLGELMKGVSVAQSKNQISLAISFSIDLLDKFEGPKHSSPSKGVL